MQQKTPKNRFFEFFPPESVITLLRPDKDFNFGYFPPQTLGVTLGSFRKKSIFDVFLTIFVGFDLRLGKLENRNFTTIGLQLPKKTFHLPQFST